MKNQIIPMLKTAAGQPLPTGLNQFNISMPLPDPDPILRQALHGRTAYRDIIADSRVSSLLESRQGGLFARTPVIQDTASPENVRKAVENLIGSLNMYDIITDIWDAIPFGFIPVEIIWDIKDGLWHPVKIAGRDPANYFFNGKGDLILRSALSSEEINCSEGLNLYRVIPVRRQSTSRNPWGVPLASRLFWPVAFKRGGLEFWMEFVEKYGSPFTVGKYQPGTDELEQKKIAAALAMLRRGGTGVFPEGTNIDFLDSAAKGASAALYENLVRWATEEISVAILGHVGSSNATAGKLGGDNTAMAIRDEIIDSDARIFSEFFNTLIRHYVAINFGNVEAPTLEFQKDRGVLKEVADRDEVLSKMGVSFKPSYISRTYGIDSDDFTMAANPVQTTPALSLNSSGIYKMPLQHTSMYGRSAIAPDSSDPVQQLTDQVLSFGSPMDSMIADIEKMVENATSLEDLRKEILASYSKLDAGALTEILTQAFTIATISGMAGAQ